MKVGRTLTELATEIERQQNSKRDFRADTRKLTMVPNGSMKLALADVGEFGLNDWSHGQIAERIQIPKKYYDRLLAEAPQLLATNVNHWFNNAPESRTVRTLDGRVRAFVSNKYRTLDNYDLMEAVLPILGEAGIEIESCQVTEKRLYLKAVNPRITEEISEGDAIQAGLCISNSEIGAGSLKIEPLLYRLVCTNGMISQDHTMRKYHTGGAGSVEDGVAELLRDETRQAADKAFWMKVRDLTQAALEESLFKLQMDKFRATLDATFEAAPDKVVEVVSTRLGLNEQERGGVLKHLIEGKELSLYGVINAVTRTAQDEFVDYDRSTDLERAGGTLVELSRKDWSLINEEAATV